MSFAGSRYLQGVEKFETDALGIPNIYFSLGRRTSDIRPVPVAGFSQIFSGCFDITNIYGLNRDGTELEEGAGGQELGTYTRFLRIKSDNFPFNDNAYAPGSYKGGAQGYRSGEAMPVLDPTFGLGVNPGDFSTENGFISGSAANRISAGSNTMLSRFLHTNVVDDFDVLIDNASSRNTVTLFDICGAAGSVRSSPQPTTPGDPSQSSNAHGHGYVVGCCRIEPGDPVQDANLDDLDAGVTSGFFTLVAGETGPSFNNTGLVNDHKLELYRHLSTSYEGPHNTSTKWQPDFSTADKIQKDLTFQTTNLNNAINGVDNNGNSLDPFSALYFNDLNFVVSIRNSDICTNKDGHIFAHALPLSKMIKIEPQGNDFSSAKFEVVKHSVLVKGNGGYLADGTEKEDPNKLPVSSEFQVATFGPSLDGLICDTTGQFNIHEIDSEGNPRRLTDRVLFGFCVDSGLSPWPGFYDFANSTPGDNYNQGFSLRGLYIMILDETKTKVAYDSNNPNWDYRAIYFYPVIETSFIGTAGTHTIMFPFASTQTAIVDNPSGTDRLARVRTGSVTLRPNFPEN